MEALTRRYDDASHTYYVEGVRWPSVTEALKFGGLIDGRFYTAEAAARGTAVHAVCEYTDGGRNILHERAAAAVWAGTDERAAVDAYRDVGGYHEAYEAFLSDCRPVYEKVERLVWHDTLRYGGRPDRKVRDMGGESGVLELKTGAPQQWHGYQLALYQLADASGARWVVYLQENGRYKLRRMRQADDYRTAIEAVRRLWAAVDRQAEGVLI